MMRWDRFLLTLRGDPGEWKLAGKGLSEGAVESLKATGADVVTKRLDITRGGKPIFDVMARWPKEPFHSWAAAVENMGNDELRTIASGRSATMGALRREARAELDRREGKA